LTGRTLAGDVRISGKIHISARLKLQALTQLREAADRVLNTAGN
jgi:hypothetical protein